MEEKKIEDIIEKIKKLENELSEELRKKGDEFYYTIENNKIKFEEQIIKKGKEGLIGSLAYLSTFSFGAILTIPFIWGMMIPIVLIDMAVTLYQWVCFPIYKIPRVKRKDYVVIDRFNLFYLDKVERVNCLYCEYFNGVIAYVREIAGRTEQYWCPIKHGKPLRDKHSRYDNFFDYGDYTKYREELEKRRSDFNDLEEEKR
ncbi:MAG: hypothetical protein KU29_08080 [Sulfurovum sp. FS06-10]|nr:MAG: hypothetical protein KU29_08080 [Sulfurovum sp. FS06-10]